MAIRVVTIDGPAGAGKSTVSKRLAERLGWRLLDTGAMYRALTLAALRSGIDLESADALGELAESTRVELPRGQVLLNGEDVAGQIRSVEVTNASRYLADNPRVRRRLTELQRAFAAVEGEILTEGRDQGTIVFPDAFVKIYLTASDEERARRRHTEFVARGESIALETVLADLQARDARDAARAIAPMKPADDAKVVDTSGLDFDQVVTALEQMIRSALS